MSSSSDADATEVSSESESSWILCQSTESLTNSEINCSARNGAPHRGCSCSNARNFTMSDSLNIDRRLSVSHKTPHSVLPAYLTTPRTICVSQVSGKVPLHQTLSLVKSRSFARKETSVLWETLEISRLQYLPLKCESSLCPISLDAHGELTSERLRPTWNSVNFELLKTTNEQEISKYAENVFL